jgi:hypothetical protein
MFWGHESVSLHITHLFIYLLMSFGWTSNVNVFSVTGHFDWPFKKKIGLFEKIYRVLVILMTMYLIGILFSIGT